jgi:hypothetical protein
VPEGIPDPLFARCTISVDAPSMGRSMSTGCALIVDRPGRAHLAVLGPFGGPLLTAQTDGEGLAVTLPREGLFLQGDLASELERLTRGNVNVDDLVGALVGDPPEDDHPDVTLTYGPYAAREGDGAMLPTEVGLTIVPLDLTLHLAYREWSTPDPVPDVFDQTPPEGMTTEDLWETLSRAL